jgi:glutathione-specific gamma-glutamylcyclotransferase
MHPSPPLDLMRCDPQAVLDRVLAQWRDQGAGDLWLFAYGSLIWNPECAFVERRLACAYGWHRALKMWSRINRGTPECPGLVFCLLSGGSCYGVAYRIEARQVEATLRGLWPREMPTGVYDPRLIRCRSEAGALNALAFTLARSSPNYTGELPMERYRQIFSESCGRFGSTRQYAETTLASLRAAGIEDRALAQLIAGAT